MNKSNMSNDDNCISAVCSTLWIIIALVCLLVEPTNSSNSWSDNTDLNSPTRKMYCPDLQPQSSLDLEEIMEKWYVMEVIKHKADPHRATISGHYVVNSCPIVTIRSTNRASLRLLWSEEAGNLEYFFRIPDPFDGPGFWDSRELQNGTLLSSNYTQFVGKVQVMKAVGSHMVLTFCSTTTDNQLYSILLSREQSLQNSDANGVHNLLERNKLKIRSVQKTCRNSASRFGMKISSWMMNTVLVALISQMKSVTFEV